MSHVVDFEQYKDIGDYRYYCVRLNQEAKVERQLLKGDRPDTTCRREMVPEDQIPAQLVSKYRMLRAGNLPAVA